MFDNFENDKNNVFSTNYSHKIKLTNSLDMDDPSIEQNNELQIKRDLKQTKHMMRFFNKQSSKGFIIIFNTFLLSNTYNILFSDLNLEALSFMRGIMDECTHLKNFKTPIDLDLVTAVCAKRDGYVPQNNTMKLEDIWPGAEVRYVDTGHVAAFLLHRNTFK